MVRMLVTIDPQSIKNAPASYGKFAFRKLGVCCWTYSGFSGEVEWINSPQFVTESKYPDVDGFRWHFMPGVYGNVVPTLSPLPASTDITIGGKVLNPATGKGMPVKSIP